ncbi:Sorbin and SH3 domain-containing protein 2 [Physocladia obscura]|uniref:Sorbin and SH3 domain-containing protein 2 n=1 Tax=Physocladia obscura TaxID=109957 RepID=A0AAD5SYL9_9FUNG|nr:Sorbin and SH3 domain-containing protein 2 [Physocladia obscura]
MFDDPAYNVFIPSTLSGSVTDAASLDSYLTNAFDTANDTGTFGAVVRSAGGYDCTDWNGTGLRYYRTSNCAYLITSGIGVVATGASAACTAAGTVFPLCLSTFSKFETSWATTLSNPTFCPNGEAQVSKDLSSQYQGVEVDMSTNTATCTVSMAVDAANCGFETAAEATAFCATTTVATESCCSSFVSSVATTSITTTASVAGIVSSTNSALATSSSTSTTTTSSSSTSLPIPIIAGAGGGALLIIIALVAFCCWRKRRQRAATTVYEMDTDTQNFNKSAAPMGFANATPMAAQIGMSGRNQQQQSDVCQAVYDYTASMGDELSTMVGDKIILKVEYDDGWGYGFNTRTRKEGAFPLDILDRFQGGAQGYNDGNRNNRVSSMYGPSGNNNKNNTESYYDGGNNTDSYYAPGGNNTDSFYDGGTNTDSYYAPGGGNNTDSSYYPQSEYGTDSVYAPGGVSGGNNIHEAVYDFTPEQDDEVELRVGDKVELKHQYDDGWAHGKNLAINKEGLFPLDCLQGFDGPQQFDAEGKKTYNNRVSSMYGAESVYTNSVYYGNNTDSFAGMTTPYCLPLTGSKLCPDFVSYSAYIAIGSITDVTSFDAYVTAASSDNSTNASDFGAAMVGSDGTGLRYQATALCIELVGFGIGNTDTATPCNPAGTILPVCQSTVTKFANAWNTVFSNTAFCPNGENTAANNYVTYLTGLSSSLSSSSTCIVGESNEVNNCGAGAGAFIIIAVCVYCFCFRKKKTLSLDEVYGKTGNDEYGDLAMSKMQPAPIGKSTPPSKMSKDIYASKFNYKPQQPDELQTFAGDRVVVKHRYDDGWGYGSNTRTGLEGLFPLDLLDGIDLDPFSQGIQKQDSGFNKRVSSLYGPPAGGFGQQQQSWNQQPIQPPPVAIPMPMGNKSINNNKNINFSGGGGPKIDENILNVIKDFDPSQSDEMELRVGDPILVKEEYDDGWGFGTNKVTNQSGLFPLDCVDRLVKKHDVRNSSLMAASATPKLPGQQQQKPFAAVAAAPFPASDTFDVVEDFDPENGDEIELRVGDKVKVTKKYDDGWCTGLNLATNQSGLLPLDCLSEFATGQQKPIKPDGKKLQKQRLSSIYDADFSYGANAVVLATAATASDIYDVVEDFDPENGDEIELRVGDKVKVTKQYDDGWCTGLNTTTNQTGLLPLDCLSTFATGQQKPVKPDGKKLQKQRLSSIYDADFSYGANAVVPATAAAASDMYDVVEDFDPENVDEIELRVGDKVKVTKKYDDGWCTGVNTTTNLTGLLPLDCLSAFATGQQKSVKPDGKKLQKQRISSIYDADFSYSAAPSAVSVPALAAKSGQSDVYDVVEDFDPENGDEIELRVGDKVKVTKQYDDGWCTGLNMATNQTGLLPLDCLSAFATGQQKVVKPDGKKLQKQRMSSIYDGDFSYGTPSEVPSAAATFGPVSSGKFDSYTVAEDFDPENGDEIELRVGDQVQVQKKYDDGWCTGLNTATNQTGLFPLDCLSGFTNGQQKPVKADGKKLQKQRMSSIYDADFSYSAIPPASSTTAAASNTYGIYAVTEDFDPENADEIELRVGDNVQVKKQYDDGWCTGVNTATNQTGLLPLDCLAGFSSGQQKPVKPDGKKLQKQRVSSIYDADFSSYGGGGGYGGAAPPALKAVFDYQPTQKDEMDIRVGDRIELKKQFEDGWAEGRNLETNQSGLFPLDCLPGYGADTGSKAGNKNRTSSLYGY